MESGRKKINALALILLEQLQTFTLEERVRIFGFRIRDQCGQTFFGSRQIQDISLFQIIGNPLDSSIVATKI
jgi:hypothetical protein